MSDNQDISILTEVPETSESFAVAVRTGAIYDNTLDVEWWWIDQFNGAHGPYVSKEDANKYQDTPPVAGGYMHDESKHWPKTNRPDCRGRTPALRGARPLNRLFRLFSKFFKKEG
tara:strand:- start:907 stop:1251 length:345 start_codon:yes stop_codon:yes gene_type:complete